SAKYMDSVNMNTKGRLRIIPAILAITVVMCACGSSKSTYTEMAAGAPAAAAEEYAYDTAAYDGGVVLRNEAAPAAEAYEYDMADEAAAAEEYVQEGGGQGAAAVPETARKLIKTVNISAETEDFDTLVPKLQKQVETLGGYIESISVYDVNSYYVEDQRVKQRCANLTARVPKEKLDGFLAQVGEQTNVTSRSENVEDVTLQYVDLESRKKALLTEQERLLELMGKAESVEDIIAIEGRLSEVRYQLESMESQLRTYDNQIDYSTVYLSIEEVRKYSAPQTATVWQRIARGFMKSLEDIGLSIQNFAIGLVIDIPYFVLGLLAIVVIFFILRALIRRFKKSRYARRLRERHGRLAEWGREVWHRHGAQDMSAKEPGMEEAAAGTGQPVEKEQTDREKEEESVSQETGAGHKTEEE
ncbi:MAG: DUF4349 domain-containing protein, partial [Lachnospiraceae bacterium]|nr:DUF4349 domain-containing protein [Lachnospiraceae bacterium]